MFGRVVEYVSVNGYPSERYIPPTKIVIVSRIALFVLPS